MKTQRTQSKRRKEAQSKNDCELRLVDYKVGYNISRKGRKVKRRKEAQNKMTENEISHKVIGIALELHTHLGPGLLESVYEHSLAYELRSAGLYVEQQYPMPFIYKEIQLECGYRLDLIVEKKVIVEIKSIDALAPVHFAQTLTYLKLSGCKLGLLINFNTIKLKDGIQRIVNGL